MKNLSPIERVRSATFINSLNGADAVAYSNRNLVECDAWQSMAGDTRGALVWYDTICIIYVPFAHLRWQIFQFIVSKSSIFSEGDGQ